MKDRQQHGTRILVPARPLTHEERSVLKRLVREVDADPEILACQERHAMVTEECDVRCGMVIFGVSESACATINDQNAPATGDGPDKDGAPASVLLHIRDGYIWMLEVYRHDGQPVRGLPDLDKTVFYGTKSAPP